MRENKFGTTLTGLIKARGQLSIRKKLCERVGISAGTLSNYERNKAKPPLDTLLQLADALEVSLDYLVTGEEFKPTGRTAADSARDYSEYVDASLTRILAQTDRRSWLSGRIAIQLQGKIDEAAKELASEGALRAIPGLLDDNICAIVETYSRKTSIYNTFFDYSFVDDASDGTPGKFFEIVAENLQQGGSYRYLLAPGPDWTRQIAGFKAAMYERVGAEAASRCEVVVARESQLSGLGLYELDVDALRYDAPIVWEMIQEYVDERGRFAYIIPPTTNIHGDLIFPLVHLPSVFTKYDEMWASARGAGRRP